MDQRVLLVGAVDDFLKAVMGNDAQAIHGHHAGTLAIRQAQATTDGLLGQNFRSRGA
ncbi:hypothetical protein D3C71_2240610 [compost metagenome]